MTTALQDALSRYRSRLSPAMKLAAPHGRCGERREGDELVCQCGLRWDAHEERPPCPR